ncbi:hypothetical protein [Gracilibacillus timonensis]|uniref:hypothetical protein n=1 Tax=Gracilibacillus timonensis TaxID=1816696 RepID=UPI00082605E6|nr:hypothetical protein [Gracilibacillus timonensis]
MKALRWMPATMAFLLLMGCGGTGSDEENIFTEGIRKAGDTITHWFGDDALTSDRSLKGERTFEEGKYTGTYQATYQQFSQSENLFGGASLDQEADGTLTITFQADIQHGEVRIYWNTVDSGKKVLFDEAGEHTTTIDLNSGWEYLSIEGENLDGEVQLEVE